MFLVSHRPHQSLLPYTWLFTFLCSLPCAKIPESATPGMCLPPLVFYSSLDLVAQMVKNLPAVRETWVQSLDWEDPLEKGKTSHSSILAWRIPWTVKSWGWRTVRHDFLFFPADFCQNQLPLWRLPNGDYLVPLLLSHLLVGIQL